MLRRVLQELEAARGPLSLDELSRQLGIERDALNGMLQALVRLGHLRVDGTALAACDQHCVGCRAVQQCSSPSRLLRTYSVVSRNDNLQG